MKIKLSIIASSLLLITTCIFAESTNVAHDKSKANNEVDNREKYSENIQQGWGMYYENNETNPQEQSQQNNEMEQQVSDSNKTVIQLLSELLKTNKEILKTDKEILQVLKNEFDPTPKTIIGADGTECKENESANCYSMPTFTKEAKLPVYKNFFANPSIQSAAEVVMWEDKHIWEVRQRGQLQQQALIQFGDSLRPNNGSNSVEYRDPVGAYDKMRQLAYDKVMMDKYYQNKLSIHFYLGDDFAENTIFATRLVELQRDFEVYADVSFKIIFKSQTAYDNYVNLFKVLNDRSGLAVKKHFKIEIAKPKDFADRGIYGYPSVAVHDTVNNTLQIIVSSMASTETIKKMMLKYLYTKQLLKDSELSDYKINTKEIHKDQATKMFGLSEEERARLFNEKTIK